MDSSTRATLQTKPTSCSTFPTNWIIAELLNKNLPGPSVWKALDFFRKFPQNRQKIEINPRKSLDFSSSLLTENPWSNTIDSLWSGLLFLSAYDERERSWESWEYLTACKPNFVFQSGHFSRTEVFSAVCFCRRAALEDTHERGGRRCLSSRISAGLHRTGRTS